MAMGNNIVASNSFSIRFSSVVHSHPKPQAIYPWNVLLNIPVPGRTRAVVLVGF